MADNNEVVIRRGSPNPAWEHSTGVVFPDIPAVVGILKILAPFSAAERKLILQTVEANPLYPKAVGANLGKLHWIETAEK